MSPCAIYDCISQEKKVIIVLTNGEKLSGKFKRLLDDRCAILETREFYFLTSHSLIVLDNIEQITYLK
jgi:hypothetical protein